MSFTVCNCFLDVLIVCTLVSRLQVSSQEDQTYCNATLHGESANITCYFVKDITKIRPMVVTIERYSLDNYTMKPEEVLICTWTTEAENNCEIKVGYEMKGADNRSLYLNIAKATAGNAGLYACKMMYPDAKPASPNTCKLLVEGRPTAPVQPTTATDNPHNNEKEITPQTNANEFSQTTGLPVQEGSVLLGLIGAVVAVVVVVAVATTLIAILLVRRCRRQAGAENEDRIAEDWITEGEEEPTFCDRFRHCNRASSGDVVFKENDDNNRGLVEDKAEKFGGDTSGRLETKQPLVKNSRDCASGNEAMKSTSSDKSIDTQQLKEPLLGNEIKDKNDLAPKSSRSNSQEEKPQWGSENTEKPTSPTDDRRDSSATYNSLFVEARANLKPVPENANKEQRDRLASLYARKNAKEKTKSEAKEYEKEPCGVSTREAEVIAEQPGS